jgi:hypothetical protein
MLVWSIPVPSFSPLFLYPTPLSLPPTSGRVLCPIDGRRLPGRTTTHGQCGQQGTRVIDKDDNIGGACIIEDKRRGGTANHSIDGRCVRPAATAAAATAVATPATACHQCPPHPGMMQIWVVQKTLKHNILRVF